MIPKIKALLCSALALTNLEIKSFTDYKSTHDNTTTVDQPESDLAEIYKDADAKGTP